MKNRTFLRRAERDDLDTVVAWMEDPDFQYFLYGDALSSPKRIRENIVGMLGRPGANTVPTAIYLIADSTEGGPVGLVSLQKISWRNRSCTMDLYIGSKESRNGIIAAETAYRALEYCFDELNLHRVSAFIYDFNSSSWRLLERAGAVRELTLREHVLRDGKLRDVYGYGLLASEYRAFRADSPYVERLSIANMIKAHEDGDGSGPSR